MRIQLHPGRTLPTRSVGGGQAAARAAVLVAALVVVAACSAGSTGSSSTSAGSSAGPAISLPPDFPLGTWVITITEADLRAGGITQPGLIAENVGTFTRTARADGTWTVVQSDPGGRIRPVFSGTFRPTGDHEYEETTLFPPDYAGEVIRFRWALEGDGLRVEVLDPPDEILPIQTEAHLWERP